MVRDTQLEYAPTTATHPGEIVVEYLEFNAWSQRDLARRTGLTPKTISEICSGKAPVTAPTALALERVFQRPAHFWLSLQRRYDEARARQREAVKLEHWKQWASEFPLAEMKRNGWLEEVEHKANSVDSLLSFLAVSSPDSWASVWEACNVAYRQTRQFKTSTQAISAWVRATELFAEETESEVEFRPFDEAKFRAIIPALRRETKKPAEEFTKSVPELCASAGVLAVWVPELKHTGISGCARWLTDEKALIALTLRYKWDDQHWFTFFHECGHILLHKKRGSFVLDNAAGTLLDNVVDPQMQREEEEANRFAADTLIPPDQLFHFIEEGDYSAKAILEFAARLDIGPGIVVGRLQHEGLLKFNQGQELKRKFEWTVRT